MWGKETTEAQRQSFGDKRMLKEGEQRRQDTLHRNDKRDRDLDRMLTTLSYWTLSFMTSSRATHP